MREIKFSISVKRSVYSVDTKTDNSLRWTKVEIDNRGGGTPIASLHDEIKRLTLRNRVRCHGGTGRPRGVFYPTNIQQGFSPRANLLDRGGRRWILRRNE